MADAPAAGSQRTEREWSIAETPAREDMMLLRHCPKFLVLGLVLGLLPASSALAATRGYVSRPCGFDLNHNGVIGEPADCNICGQSDGTLSVGGSSYTQVYVDCSAGNNSNAGTRSAPLRTIASALQRSPSSGATLAVCVKGTCASGTESFPLSPPAGLTGSYSRSTSPSENAPFNFPTKPTILSGWDANGDGNYPPASGETAALDGGNTALEALNLPGRMELAHLTVQKFANTTAAQNQYTYVASINDGAQYVYVHDTTWDQIHQATALSLGSGEWIIFPLYGNPGPVHAAWINNTIKNYSSFIWRGSTATGAQAGPLRIQNTTIRGRATIGNGTPYVLKIWGPYTGIDYLDNDADMQPSLWLTGTTNNETFGPNFAQCTQNILVRNNVISNFQTGLRLQPSAGSGYCSNRPVTNVTIDANEIRNTYPWNCYGGRGIEINGSDISTAYVGDVTITNNFIWSQTFSNGGFQSGLLLNPGHGAGSCSDLAGKITIAGNTIDLAPRRYCGGDSPGFGMIALTDFDETSTCRQQTFEVRDNAFVNRRTDGQGLYIATDWAPSGWVANNNTYNDSSVNGTWSWNRGNQSTLAAWRTSSGQDANSKDCQPLFVNATTGDLHLQSGDTCAKDAGVSTAAMTKDYDSDARPQGAGWDIGADEFRSGSVVAAPVLLDVTPLP
jgi:hypothetical protein